MIQVLPELESLDVMLPKIAKLQKIHSMAMAYKTEFEHVKGRANKHKNQRSKSKCLHKCHGNNLKTKTPSTKNKRNERAYTKRSKMPKHLDNNNYSEKFKLNRP